MLFSTIGQIYVFLWMAASGVIIGAWYMALAGLRKLLQAGFWLSLVSDIAFGAGAACIFLYFLIAANYGRMRLFTLLGAVVGICLFAFGLYPPVSMLLSMVKGRMCRLCCSLKQNRLINVIFR